MTFLFVTSFDKYFIKQCKTSLDYNLLEYVKILGLFITQMFKIIYKL
jgi:hypothetical protein